MSLTMREVVERHLGPPASVKGRIAKWPCPTGTHADKVPSFAVYSDDMAWCFGCHWAGNARWFLLNVMGYSKDRADRWLGNYGPVLLKKKRTGIVARHTRPNHAWQGILAACMKGFRNRMLEPCASWAWVELNKRGIDRATWERFGIGYNPQEIGLEALGLKIHSGIILPALFRSELWSVNVRTVSGVPKYHRPENPDLGYGVSVPFGLEQLCGHSVLIILESELDAMATARAVGSWADVLALRGTGNLRLLGVWESVIRRYEHVVYCFDADKGGMRAAGEIEKMHPLWERLDPTIEGAGVCDLFRAGVDLSSFFGKTEGEWNV